MAILTFLVTAEDTALALGSGDVAVLATPRLLAWMEAASVRAVAPHLTAEQTSVGVTVRVQHRRATPVGRQVRVAVLSTSVQDGRAEVEVVAYQLDDDAPGQQPGVGRPAAPPSLTSPEADTESIRADGSGAERSGAGTVVGTARITRAVVDRAAFLARVNRD